MNRELLEQERSIWRLEGELVNILGNAGLDSVEVCGDGWNGLIFSADRDWKLSWGKKVSFSLTDPHLFDFAKWYALIGGDPGYYEMHRRRVELWGELEARRPPNGQISESLGGYEEVLRYIDEKHRFLEEDEIESNTYIRENIGILLTGFIDRMEKACQKIEIYREVNQSG